MDDDIDIYADLPSFETKPTEDVAPVGEQSTVGQQLELKKQIADLSAKLENFRRINENLESNLFSLLKTARAEIARKDNTIDELRKKLDDSAFRRGGFSKHNAHATKRANFRETVTKGHQDASTMSFPAKENQTENLSTVDTVRNQNNVRQNKSALIPMTLFGERLLKRMADEQCAEMKDKQCNKVFVDGNSGQNMQGYTVESDKENGSISEPDPCGKNTLHTLSVATRENGTESTKVSSATMSAETVAQSRATDTSSHRSSAPPTKCTGKRSNQDGNRHIPAKRTKLVENVKNVRDNTFIEGGDNSLTLQHRDSESTSQGANRRLHASRDAGARYSREHQTEDTSERDKRRSGKGKTKFTREKKDVNAWPSRYRDKPVQSSGPALSERNTNGEYRRVRQREYRRVDDHRSQLKSSYEKYRDEKHGRIRHDRQGSYEERTENRYNFRSGSADQIKLPKTHSPRVTVKSSIPDRTLTDEKRSETKRYDRYNEPESHRSRRSENVASKRSENLRKHSENEDRTVDRTNEAARGNGQHVADEKLGKQESKILENLSTELEEGELAKTPTSSPQKSEKLNEPERSVDSNNVESEQTAKAERPSWNVSEQPTLGSSANVDFLQNQAADENIESVENVESIEKFIRDFTSTRDKDRGTDKVPTTARTIPESKELSTDASSSVKDVAVDESVGDREVVSRKVNPNDWNKVSTSGSVACGTSNSEGKDKEQEHGRTRTKEAAPTIYEGNNLSINEQGRAINPADEKTKVELEADVLKHQHASSKEESTESRNGLQNDGESSAMIASDSVGDGNPKAAKELNKNACANGEKSLPCTPGNIQGQIVVFARRKKPVRLANHNANMTVLINGKNDAGSVASAAKKK